MAITIEQSPSGHSAIGSKTVVVATSTNSGNNGFMYDVTINLSDISESASVKVAPNPHGVLVFEPNQFAKSFLRHSNNEGDYDITRSIHAFNATQIWSPELPVAGYNHAGILFCTIEIREAWVIDGVLTTTEVGMGTAQTFYYNAYLSLQTPLNFDYYNYLEINRAVITDREIGTHFFDKANEIGLSNDAIYIPTYESDWGVWSVRNAISPDVAAEKVRIAILPNSGPPVQFVTNLALYKVFLNCGLYPANINTSTIVGIPKPQDYPNWKAVYFQLLNSDDVIVSKSIVMYNAARFGPCYGDQVKIRLAWVGRYGGWEYFNFCQNSFEEYATEKKIAYRAIGNYGDVASGAPFAFNTFDESEIVTDMAVQKFVNASSDWVQDGEREFLKGLFLSKQVHWVQDDGSHIPVIVQSDGYQVKKVYGSGPLFKLDIKVKIAQEQFN
jgi:hypothetical protein